MKKLPNIFLIVFVAAAMLLPVVGPVLAQSRVTLADSTADWSSTGAQGYRNWYYKFATDPTVSYSDMTWDASAYWKCAEWGGLPSIYKDHIVTQGGGTITAFRQWHNTSISGLMHVTAVVQRLAADSNGITIRLFRNNTEAWSQHLVGSDIAWHGYDFDITVSPGDNLSFGLDPLGTVGEQANDLVRFSVPALTGHVDLQNYTPVPYTPVAVTVELIQGGSVVRKETVVVGEDGNYLIPNVANGTYDVAFKAASWLRKVVKNVIINTSGTCDVSLTNGDIDGDNNITTTDVSTLLVSLDQPNQVSQTTVSQQGNTYSLTSPTVLASIDATTGAVAGIWDRQSNRRLITSSYDVYYAETRTTDWTTDGRRNSVISATMDSHSLTLSLSNPDLPGITLLKKYYFTTTGGEERILCSYLQVAGSPQNQTLLKVSSNTIFDPSFLQGATYDRVHATGTSGDPRQQISPSEITAPLIERGWFNSTEGRAQFAAFNPTNQLGMAECLYKVDDRWHFPQGMAQSWWRSDGWEMGGPGQFVGTGLPAHSFETYYHMFRGDRLVYHREYLNLPEYKAVMADWRPNSKSTGIKLSMSPDWTLSASAPDMAEFQSVYAALLRPGEITIDTSGYYARVWGDYPASNGTSVVQLDATTGAQTGTMLAQDYRTIFSNLHNACPAAYVGHYNWLHDIAKRSQTYAAHPEWVLKDKSGAAIPGMYYADLSAQTNWQPAFMDYTLQGLLNQVDYFGFGLVYLDFGVCSWYPDWDRQQVMNLNYFADWMKKMHDELAKRGKLLFINGLAGQAYFDIAYHEISGAHPNYTTGQSWRVGANVDLMTKFYAPAGAASIPIYWCAGQLNKDRGDYNEERYRNLILATGLKAAGASMDPYADAFPNGHGAVDRMAEYQYQYPVHEASMELIPSQFAEIGLSPAWWRDTTTDYEAYTLKQGNSYLLNVISHCASVPTADSTADWSSDGTAGYKNWSYKFATSPTVSYSDMVWDAAGYWKCAEWGGLPSIYKDHIITQGGGTITGFRQWHNTSYTGTMHVTAVVQRLAADSNGVTIRLFRNNTQVWSQFLVASDVAWHGYDFDITVSAGDNLSFGVDPMGTAGEHVNDLVKFFPVPYLATGVFTVDPNLMGFQPGKKVYIWEHVAREQADFVKQVPQPAGWDKMFKEYRFSSVVPPTGSNITLTLAGLSKETVRMVSLTQVPAFVYSAAGQQAQLLLSNNLGCSIDGVLDETQKQTNLCVNAEQPVQVLASWPFADTRARVVINGGCSVVSTVQDMCGGRFVLFNLDKGAWNVKITSY